MLSQCRDVTQPRVPKADAECACTAAPPRAPAPRGALRHAALPYPCPGCRWGRAPVRLRCQVRQRGVARRDGQGRGGGAVHNEQQAPAGARVQQVAPQRRRPCSVT